ARICRDPERNRTSGIRYDPHPRRRTDVAESIVALESMDANGVERTVADVQTRDVNLKASAPHRSGASALLIAHVALIGFATLAMVTILAGEFPTWMQGPYTPIVYEYSWRYTGQIYVILGLLAAISHAAPRFGVSRALLLFGCAAAIALVSELC